MNRMNTADVLILDTSTGVESHSLSALPLVASLSPSSLVACFLTGEEEKSTTMRMITWTMMTTLTSSSNDL